MRITNWMRAGTVLLGLWAVCPLAVMGQDWELSIGPSYRTFGDIDFDSYEFNNPNHADYIDADESTSPNLLTYDSANGPYILDVSNSEASVRNVTFTGDNADLDGAPGFVLGANRKVAEGWTLDLSLTGVFADQDETFTGSTNVDVTSYALDPNNITPTAARWVAKGISPTTTPAQIDTALNFDTTVNLYTVGLGVASEDVFGAWTIRIGAGPTLSLADYDMSRTETLSWASSGQNVYSSQTEDDDGLEVHAGGYANVGVEYNFSERMGLALNGRYDWIPSDMETDFGEVDLSGFSGQLRFTYKY